MRDHTEREREALMVRVRADFSEANIGLPVDIDDVENIAALCAEVERLTRERELLRGEKAIEENAKLHAQLEVLRLTAEVERRREEVSVLRMFIGKNEVEEANEELANLDAARTTGGRDA